MRSIESTPGFAERALSLLTGPSTEVLPVIQPRG